MQRSSVEGDSFRSSVFVHTSSRAHVHVVDVWQEQLKALVAGGVDSYMDGCLSLESVEAERVKAAQPETVKRNADGSITTE